MPWLQHFFAIWILAHLLWAAVLLEKEWRRIRCFADPEDRDPATGVEAPQVTTPHL
jgi:hypothetical protein